MMSQQFECVEIGGIPVALSTSDPTFLDLLRRRYEGFLASSSPEFELEFDLIVPASNSSDDVRVRRDGKEWLIERGDFFARWNPATGRGKVRQISNTHKMALRTAPHSLYMLDCFGRHTYDGWYAAIRTIANARFPRL